MHKAGRKVASVYWPVSVGAASVDYDIPELWRAHIAEDAKLLKAVSTPGLVAELETATGLKLVQMTEELPQNNAARTKFAEALFAAKKPATLTLHLAALDHAQHGYGPDTPESRAVLEGLDAEVGELVATARKAEPDVVVAIVSDHGFAPLQHAVNLQQAFIEAGLMTYDERTAAASRGWAAAPWAGARRPSCSPWPGDQALQKKVAELLARPGRPNPDYGIAGFVDAPQVTGIDRRPWPLPGSTSSRATRTAGGPAGR